MLQTGIHFLFLLYLHSDWFCYVITAKVVWITYSCGNYVTLVQTYHLYAALPVVTLTNNIHSATKNYTKSSEQHIIRITSIPRKIRINLLREYCCSKISRSKSNCRWWYWSLYTAHVKRKHLMMSDVNISVSQIIRKKLDYKLLMHSSGNYKTQHIIKSTGLKVDHINIITLIKAIPILPAHMSV